MYHLAVNELLGRSCTALAPDVFELFQVWVFVISTVVLDGRDGFHEADFTSPPLLVSRPPVVLPVKYSARDDGNAWHPWRFCQHRRTAVAAE